MWYRFMKRAFVFGRLMKEGEYDVRPLAKTCSMLAQDFVTRLLGTVKV